jgi:hypothetical protein
MLSHELNHFGSILPFYPLFQAAGASHLLQHAKCFEVGWINIHHLSILCLVNLAMNRYLASHTITDWPSVFTVAYCVEIFQGFFCLTKLLPVIC